MESTETVIAVILGSAGVLLAIIGLLVALNALRRAGELRALTEHLQNKVESLTAVQRQLHQRELERMAITRSASDAADMMLSLEGTRKTARFVFRNWGYGTARNIDMSLTPVDGDRLPAPLGEQGSPLPLKRLEPGEEFHLDTTLDYQSGASFDARLNWQDPDGAMHTSNLRLSL